ncbi:Nif3-like dinuclear metal center hexameric protein [Ilyomonas limi]|uniref:GTP cyclohydrolase 1 type 2 homolog n=1 Tax=Ilyomonas limi TaxID=2575867 RepID=A0A4U3LA67_9BACT|nr:Nif3-like dinuclear metal center hexameric protein [Ilyomonas limi]TKK71529.1 Nif3-like dinuclear metal center hexameric protein [Ilyomonas limi]
MNISEVIQTLEAYAPLPYQESYDNAGLLTGSKDWNCTGILCTLDATEAVVNEAVEKNCNLIIAHHPIIFSGLKKITGKNYVERTVIAAIKNNIAIYAIHTNLDNVYNGVSRRMAEKLGLQNCKVLDPKPGLLKKLYTYVPVDDAEKVRAVIFKAGAGDIGNYGECSFNIEGIGTYKPQEGADPYIGKIGKRAETKEIKLEIIFPAHLQRQVISALQATHPYEEVAYDVITLANEFQQVGSGMTGELPETMSETDFLHRISKVFNLRLIKHTPLLNKNVKKVALCGGAGNFLLPKAIAAGADFYITSDVKYHEFFDADGRIVFADIGHWESEQFTIDLLFDILQSKFHNFAVLKTGVRTNPVCYFLWR